MYLTSYTKLPPILVSHYKLPRILAHAPWLPTPSYQVGTFVSHFKVLPTLVKEID
jgi:hypothetical protein